MSKPQAETNPLIQDSPLPYGAPPFAQIKPEHFEPAIEWAIDRARQNIEAIKNNPDEPDFDNTSAALSFCDEDLGRIAGILGSFANSKNTADIQQVNQKVNPLLTAYFTDKYMDEGLFQRIKKLYKKKDMLGLNEERAMLLEQQYNAFVQNGVSLQGEKRARYKELTTQLGKEKLTFSNNTINHSQQLKVFVPADQAQRLDGIPEDIIASFAEAARIDKDFADDGYLINMVPPPIAVFYYAHDRSLREEVYREFNRRASEGDFDNTPIFKTILSLRDEQAKILGFEHHADRVLKTGFRMTDQYEDVLDFLHTNARTYCPAAESFYKELTAFAKEKDGIETLMPWDRNYYIKKMSEEKIGFNSQDVRPYFELNNVLKGLFAHTQKLYGVNVKRAPEGKYETISDNAMVFEIYDHGTGDIRALFYADLYSNPEKKSGAWMNALRSSGLYKGAYAIPIITNDMNLQKPEKGKPTLLDENEVETLWHEFGHACHGMLGKGEFPELSGVSTSWDYVELPSQINECWAFKPESLAHYALHHENGDALPEHFVKKFEALKHYEARWQGMRQTELGLIDMAYFTSDVKTVDDLRAFEDATLKEYEIEHYIKLPESPALATTFGHIVGGYAAGYYVYKWADALVADVRTSFEKAEKDGLGLYPEHLCRAFKEEMIVPGGTRLASDMLKNFKEKAGYSDTGFDSAAMFAAEGISFNRK